MSSIYVNVKVVKQKYTHNL